MCFSPIWVNCSSISFYVEGVERGCFPVWFDRQAGHLPRTIQTTISGGFWVAGFSSGPYKLVVRIRGLGI